MVVGREGTVDMSNNNPGERQESDAIDTGQRVWVDVLGVEQLDGIGVDGKTLEYLNNDSKNLTN